MEGILLIILSLIISSFFGDKKKASQKTPPPVNQKSETRPRSLKELEDWTRQMLDQSDQKVPPKARQVAERVEREVRSRLPQTPSQVPGNEIQERVPVTIEREIAERRPGRLSVHQKTEPVVQKELPVAELIDSTDDLARAIVLSEILAPPVSKRR